MSALIEESAKAYLITQIIKKEKLLGRELNREEKLAVVDECIEQSKKDLENCKGTETEVYTRIVGYYRQVGNFNKGKRSEFGNRLEYDVSKASEKAKERMKDEN